MYRVFWIESEVACSEAFPPDALAAALAFAEALRARRRTGESLSFVTIVSEDPGQVGESGAADPRADYDWVKRRPPPGRRG